MDKGSFTDQAINPQLKPKPSLNLKNQLSCYHKLYLSCYKAAHDSRIRLFKIKKRTKLRLSNYWTPSTGIEFCIWAALCTRFNLSVPNTRSLERTGQKLFQARLDLRQYPPDNNLVYLPQGLLSPRVICDSFLSRIGFPTSWHLSFKKIQEQSSKGRIVYEIWLIIEYRLYRDWRLCSHPDHGLPTRLLLPGLRPSQSTSVIFLLILQPFSFNLYPPEGRFLWWISFKFSPKASFDILNNILESGFDFHVSSLGSTNVPMWERWERDDKNLPDFENMKKTYSSKAKC